VSGSSSDSPARRAAAREGGERRIEAPCAPARMARCARRVRHRRSRCLRTGATRHPARWDGQASNGSPRDDLSLQALGRSRPGSESAATQRLLEQGAQQREHGDLLSSKDRLSLGRAAGHFPYGPVRRPARPGRRRIPAGLALWREGVPRLQRIEPARLRIRPHLNKSLRLASQEASEPPGLRGPASSVGRPVSPAPASKSMHSDPLLVTCPVSARSP